MSHSTSLNTTLDYLNLFHPCHGVLVVGSGNGSWVDLIASWNVEDVVLAEADEKQNERMKKFHTLPREWKVVNALVYKDQTQCEYYHTSNSATSGLEHPDTLSAIWPNLSINSVEVRESVSIPTLLLQAEVKNINWLIIDCIPALKLLQEGVSTLHRCDVVVARVLSAEKSVLDTWMLENAFRCATVLEENNPQLLFVIYMRVLNGLQEREEYITKINALIQRRDRLIKENTALIEKQALLEEKIDENKELQHEVYEFKRAKNYYIKPNYKSRTEYTHYDDQSQEDKWQLEVYLHALGLMKKYDLQSVADLGCGSGYKLMKYLSDYRTVGLELGINLEFLREKYPERTWLESNFEIDHQLETDVLICSDVIEHIVDPDQLIRYIQKISFKYLILSTPDRELVYETGQAYLDGPPRNPAHVREWNFPEFKDYISQYFEVIEHRVTNLQQSTQMMICKQRL